MACDLSRHSNCEELSKLNRIISTVLHSDTKHILASVKGIQVDRLTPEVRT